MLVIAASLFGLTFAGLTYVLLAAMHEGMESYTSVYSTETAREFEDVFLFIPPRRITELGWAMGAGLFTAGFFTVGRLTTLSGFIAGLIAGLLLGFVGLRAPSALLTILRNRRLAKFNSQLGDTLVSMSNALKAGFSITQAVESVVRDGDKPIAQEFDVLLHQTRVGVTFSDALANLETRVGSEDLRLVVAAIETARRTGGNLTEIFERIAATIRERFRIERRISTLTAQGRLQGIVVGFMPVVIAIALVIVDPEMMLPFLHSTAGAVTIGIVTILLACGAVVIRRIVRINV